MIDTHCHLDRVADLSAALDTDLAALITVGTDPERSAQALALAQQQPRVYASVGLHPSEAERVDDPAVRTSIEALAREPKVVAIGESGFDTYWRDDLLAAQQRSFTWQAELARECDLPLILHVRDADGRDDASQAAIAALRAAGWGRGILHCCNGHAELVATGLELGWYVSFAGNLTYPGAVAIRAVAREVPPERLLVETDAPFLAPIPMRGRRNLPDYVRYTAAALAELRGVDATTLEAQLDANARRCYELSSR